MIEDHDIGIIHVLHIWKSESDDYGYELLLCGSDTVYDKLSNNLTVTVRTGMNNSYSMMDTCMPYALQHSQSK